MLRKYIYFLMPLVLLSCSLNEEYSKAYNECRAMPGNETLKAHSCARYAELSEKEAELKLKLQEIEFQKLDIISSIIRNK